MQIKNISVSNFKSFKRIEAQLNRFNVLIGPNAAGKSNFLQAIRFFRDIVRYSLENAISLQGGREYIRNIHSPDCKEALDFEISMVPDKFFKYRRKLNGNQLTLEIYEIIYKFSLKFEDCTGDYEIINDELIQKYNAYKDGGEAKLLGDSRFSIFKEKDQFSTAFEINKDIPLNEAELHGLFLTGYADFLESRKLLSESNLAHSLLIENPLFFIPHIENIKSDLRTIPIYDIDPEMPKKATSLAGKSELEENGENLAIVLRRILSNGENARKLFNLIEYVLPFVQNIKVENFLDKYLQIMVQEKYGQAQSIPAFLMSDGTIFLIAIIIALYFERKTVTVFEEPERRIHPQIISKMIDMMKDASAQKQIIISTHNPEIVKYAGLENLLFVSRDQDGFSTISAPHKKSEIKTFLKNQIGIDELFVQNLLGM